MKKTLFEIIRETFYEISDKYMLFLNATIVLMAFVGAAMLFLPPFGLLLAIGVYSCLMVGMASYTLKAVNEKPVKIEELVSRFKDLLNLFITEIIKLLHIAFWSIFLIVPGIIKCLEYSQTHFILSENKKMTTYDALAESKRLTYRRKGKILLLNMLYLFMTLIIVLFSASIIIISKLLLPISQPATISWLVVMSLALIALIVLPFVHASKAILYDSLKVENKTSKDKEIPSAFTEVANEIIKAFKPNKKKEDIGKEMKKEMEDIKKELKKSTDKTVHKVKNSTKKAVDNVKHGAKDTIHKIEKGAKDTAKKTKKAATGAKKAIEDAFEK